MQRTLNEGIMVRGRTLATHRYEEYVRVPGDPTSAASMLWCKTWRTDERIYQHDAYAATANKLGVNYCDFTAERARPDVSLSHKAEKPNQCPNAARS